MQERETRTPVTMHAHMRGEGEWARVMIRNISPHGMMAIAANPPSPGAYVEIRKASMTLVGRAIWVKGTAFGVQLIERLHFNALLRAANESWAMLQSAAPAPLTAPPAAEDASPSRTEPPAAAPVVVSALTWAMAFLLLAFAAFCAGAELLRP